MPGAPSLRPPSTLAPGPLVSATSAAAVSAGSRWPVRATIRLMELDAAAGRVRPGSVVSPVVALRRAATGLGVSAALVAVVGLVWREGLDLALPVLVAGCVQWLHEPDDRHHRSASWTGGAATLAVVAAGVVLFRDAPQDFSRDVACAALGALAGSQTYAAITRFAAGAMR